MGREEIEIIFRRLEYTPKIQIRGEGKRIARDFARQKEDLAQLN